MSFANARCSLLIAVLAPLAAMSPISNAQRQPVADHVSGSTVLPSFEVVSIRPYPPHYWPTSSYIDFTADGFNWRNTTAQDLLVYAFDLRAPHVSDKERVMSGGARWMNFDWYDVQARMSDANIAALKKLGPHDRDLYKRELIQSMLADRFKLRVHHMTRESAAWELVVAKNGPKNLKPGREGAESRPFITDFNHIRFQNGPISMLVDFLITLQNVPVVDKTGLTGKYNFSLEFSRDPDTPMPPGQSLPPTNDSEPTIRDALVDQLGLKLIPTQVPLDDIVIDHIEKPSPN